MTHSSNDDSSDDLRSDFSGKQTRQIVEVCDQFEVALSEGKTPDLMEYVERVPQELRADLQSRLEKLQMGDHAEVTREAPTPRPGEQSDLDGDFDDLDLEETEGAVVGNYKLLQRLGQGGMGTVYMAEQHHPIKRRVALKIIKLGMDSREIVARFEAERQAISMMDHHNIAKVLDVGSTKRGRPFFAMELVKGLPIVRYCEENKLNLQQRLQLFRSVCNAVQHAHQRGIIHRDLKPSNILVAEYDNEAIPKIIDFGLAKALNQKLTEKTMFTQFGQVVGTLAYMSPEQSKMNQLDVDTRTDIYSLGVILYELLTGTTPFDRERLRSEAYEKVLKIIREEEPPKPSLRLSTVQSDPSLAENRRSELSRLRGLVRGELDWIVMKALDKERSRRYETAHGLALDIGRYMDGDTVLAAPPSTVYRIRKFVVRNGLAVTAAIVFFILLSAGVIGTTLGMMRALDSEQAAIEAQDQERIARDKAEDALIVAEQARASAEKRKRQLLIALEQMSSQIVDQWLLKQRSLTDEHKKFLATVLDSYEEISQEPSADVNSRFEVANANLRIAEIQQKLGNGEAAKRAYQKARSVLETLVQNHPDETRFQDRRIDSTMYLARFQARSGLHQQAESLIISAIEYWKLKLASDPTRDDLRQSIADATYSLARTFQGRLKDDQAVEVFEQAEDLVRELVERGYRTAHNKNNLAQVLQTKAFSLRWLQREKESIAAYEQAIKLGEELVDQFPRHKNEDYRWQLAVALNDLGVLHKSKQRFELAASLYQRSRTLRESLATENPGSSQYGTMLVGSYLNLGNVERISSKPQQAVSHYLEAIKIGESVIQNDQNHVLARKFLRNSFEGLAEAYILLEDYPNALKAWQDCMLNNLPKYNLHSPPFDVRIPLRQAFVEMRAGGEPDTILMQVERVVDSATLPTDVYDEDVRKDVLGQANYNAASVYAAASENASKNEADQYAQRAMELLSSAIENGCSFHGPKGVSFAEDPDFESLRPLPAFQELIKKSEEKDKE